MMGTNAERDQPKVTTADVFALLEYLLSGSNIRLNPRARPILFVLLPTGETWRFDPKSTGALLQPVHKPVLDPEVLTVRCEPQLLVRLATASDFSLGDEDAAFFEGNIDDLLPLADALEQGGSVNAIRQRGKKK
jgi:hypothetical protein